jgi:hypothetical protein
MPKPHKVTEGGTACLEQYPDCIGCPYHIRGCPIGARVLRSPHTPRSPYTYNIVSRPMLFEGKPPERFQIDPYEDLHQVLYLGSIMDEVPWYRRWWLWLKLRLGIIKFKFEKMTMPQVKREFPPISTDVIESNSMKDDSDG